MKEKELSTRHGNISPSKKCYLFINSLRGDFAWGYPRGTYAKLSQKLTEKEKALEDLGQKLSKDVMEKFALETAKSALEVDLKNTR